MMTVSGEGSTKMALVLGFLAQLNQAQALCPQVQISQIQALLASMLGFRLGFRPGQVAVRYISYLIYDKKSDEGSNSVWMRPENSGASKVVKK